MSHAYITLPLLVLCAQPQVLAQGSSSTHTLSRAILVLSDADADKDGRIDSREAAGIPIEGEGFRSLDQDKDGFWSRDEFLLFYRQKLIASGQRVGGDLEAETTRIHALRRARQDAEARKTGGTGPEAAGGSGPAQASNATTPQAPVLSRGPSQRISVRQAAGAKPALASEGRLTAALDDLERRAASRQASKADFEKTRDALQVLRYQEANGATPDSASNDTYGKILQSLERLEKDAAAGSYSREQYADLRAAIVRRARNIEVALGRDPDPAPAVPGGSEILFRLENALSQLENRAASAGASREDFERVRAEWTALARLASQGGAGASARVADPTSETYRKLLRALGRLEERAREGAFTREDYRALREQMVHRARAIIATPPAPRVVTASIERSGAVPVSPPPAGAVPEESEGALRRSLDDLEQRAASGRAVREDFQRVRDQLTVRAGLGAGSDATAAGESSTSSEIYRKLQAALDRIEQRAAEGVYSREEYEALRAQLVRRARSAEAGVKKVEGADEETRRTPNDPPTRAEPKTRGQGASSSDRGAVQEIPPRPPEPQREPPTSPSPADRPVPKPESSGRPRS